MRFVINPILNKELKLGSRSIKMPIALTAYALVMTLFTIFILFGGLSGQNAEDIQTVINYAEFSKCSKFRGGIDHIYSNSCIRRIKRMLFR